MLKLYISFLILEVTLASSPLKEIQYKQVIGNLGMLRNTVTQLVSSRVECGSFCIVTLNYGECLAFHMEPSTGLCTCGEKIYLGRDGSGQDVHLHVNIECQKIPVPGMCASGRQAIFPLVGTI